MKHLTDHLGCDAANNTHLSGRQTEPTLGGQLGTTFDSPDLIHIENGINAVDLPVAGFSVAKIRTAVAETLNLGPETAAYVNDTLVADDHVLGPDQKLAFIRTSGRKGVGRVWTKGEFMALFHMSDADWQKWAEKGLPVDVMGSGEIMLNETQVDEWKRACTASATQPHVLKPRWDSETRTLYLGERAIKTFRQPASNQERLLTEFQEFDWPQRVEDPLAPTNNISPKRRLQVTVAALNKHHLTDRLLIRFEMDGSGEGVIWTVIHRCTA